MSRESKSPAPSRSQIDRQIDLGRLRHWNVSGTDALENLVDIVGGLPGPTHQSLRRGLDRATRAPVEPGIAPQVDDRQLRDLGLDRCTIEGGLAEAARLRMQQQDAVRRSRTGGAA
jgi:hypothetical protein